MLNTPILFLIFNRLDTTRQVFAKIREAQPKQLFIAADGPRVDRSGEAEKCELTKKIVLDNIDWDCEVKTLFRDENLGCAKGVSTAITWFFEQVDRGIILEDDCLPDKSFFPFCEELLERYKDDLEIGTICGFNIQLGISRTKYSYYFSQLFSSWGWATWANRWAKYNDVPTIPDGAILNHPAIIDWKPEIVDTFNGKIDSWAYRWQYAFRQNDFINITPNVSLIENIGLGTENATNTNHSVWWKKFVKYGQITSIKHPPYKKISYNADSLFIKLATSLPIRWRDRIRYKCVILLEKIKNRV